MQQFLQFLSSSSLEIFKIIFVVVCSSNNNYIGNNNIIFIQLEYWCSEMFAVATRIMLYIVDLVVVLTVTVTVSKGKKINIKMEELARAKDSSNLFTLKGIFFSTLSFI